MHFSIQIRALLEVYFGFKFFWRGFSIKKFTDIKSLSVVFSKIKSGGPEICFFNGVILLRFFTGVVLL